MKVCAKLTRHTGKYLKLKKIDLDPLLTFPHLMLIQLLSCKYLWKIKNYKHNMNYEASMHLLTINV